MHGIRLVKAAVMICAFTLTVSIAMGGQLVSIMRNVQAVMSHNGYSIRPVAELSGQRAPGDVGYTQAFEIIRPNGEAISLGRLNTTGVCVQIVTEKKSFNRGERAIFVMHNVKPTPPEGQRYAMYVQLTQPVRVTLRFDTFVKSGFDSVPELAVAPVPSPTPAASSTTTSTTAKKAAVQTSSTSGALTLVGDDGIEMIIPRYQAEEPETEVAAKPAESTETPSIEYSKERKIESAAPSIQYSKELPLETAKTPVESAPAIQYSKEISVESAPASAPSTDKAESTDVDRPWATKEIKLDSAPSEPVADATVNRPEGIDQVLDEYAANYKPDTTEQAE